MAFAIAHTEAGIDIRNILNDMYDDNRISGESDK